jgi:sortase A
MDLAVFEGVSEKALRRGPGHLPGTPCPGLSSVEGNCVLTGHRDSFFRALANAREGDLVVLRAGESSRRYRLTRKVVVRPEQTEVAAPTGQARLTLLTCYPFRWIGPAPLRLAWQAEPELTTAARVSR